MPKEIAHWMIAQEVFLRLDKSTVMARAISENWNLYLLASVLPDTPYYCLGLSCNELKEAVDHLHLAEENSFLALQKILKKEGGSTFEASVALFAGTLTHIVADSIFHPYIESRGRAGKISKKLSTARHRYFETAADLFFLNLNPSFYPTLLGSYIVNMEMPLRRLTNIYTGFFSLDGPNTERTLEKALLHHSRVQKSFFSERLLRFLLPFRVLFPHLIDPLLALSYVFVQKKMGIKKEPFYNFFDEFKLLVPHLTTLQEATIKETLNLLVLIEDKTNSREIISVFQDLSGPRMSPATLDT